MMTKTASFKVDFSKPDKVDEEINAWIAKKKKEGAAAVHITAMTSVIYPNGRDTDYGTAGESYRISGVLTIAYTIPNRE